MDVMTGTLEQEFLTGETGSILCTPADGQYWFKEAIKGVTDGTQTPRFVEGSSSQRLG
jgi:hypothetical protein